MAAPGWQDGMPVLQPPPIPPRRRSPVETPAQVDLMASAAPPVPPPRKTGQRNSQAADSFNAAGSKPSLMKANSMYTHDSALINFEANNPPRPNSVEISGGGNSSSIMAELADIDFAFTPTADGAGSLYRTHSTSMEDLTPPKPDSAYPDISAAFKELRETTATPPAFPMKGNYGASTSTFPGGYGWNPSLFNARASPAFGASSTAGPASASGTNTMPSAVPPPLGFGAFGNGGSSGMFPAANHGGASFYGNGPGFTGPGFHGNPFYEVNTGIGAGNSQPAGNQFLNVISSMPKAASWSDMQGMDERATNPEQQMPEPPREFSENMDLMEFTPGLPEHEYLSLDFFDPLYERGRKESVCVQDKGQNYSFGEAFPTIQEDQRPPPELRRHIRRESHEIWGVSTSQRKDSVRSADSGGPIGFEVVTAEEMFGSSDSDFMLASEAPAAADRASKSTTSPPRPPPPSVKARDQVNFI